MRSRALALLLLIALTAAGTARSVAQAPPTEVINVSFCWADIPFEQLMQSAEMIVVGTVAGFGAPEWSAPLDETG